MKMLVVAEDLFSLEQLSSLLIYLFPKGGVEVTALVVISEEGQGKKPVGNELFGEATKNLNTTLTDRKIRQGRYVDQVLRELDQGDYDLAVIQREKPSAHGPFRGTDRVIKIVEHAPCSVLVLDAIPTPPAVPGQILICDSGSEKAAAIYSFIDDFFEPWKKDLEITVLHVMSQISASPGIPGKELRSGAEQLIENQTPEGKLLQQGIQHLQEAGFNARPKIRHGLVIEEISSEVEEKPYDLVIIGSHPKGKSQAILLENIAKKIILGLDRSVLIVSAASGPSNRERHS